jgi:hypothetical protein
MPSPKKKTTKNQDSKVKSSEVIHNITSQDTSSKAELSSSKLDQELINQLLTQVSARYKNEVLSDKKIKIKEISHIASMAEEYFSCFAIIGYSIQNEEVVVLNVNSPKDEAALVDLLRATFLDIASNRP